MFKKMLALETHKNRDPAAYFSKLDQDQDGLLSVEEFRHMKQLVHIDL